MADQNAVYGLAEWGLAEWALTTGTTSGAAANVVVVSFDGGMNNGVLFSGGMNG